MLKIPALSSSKKYCLAVIYIGVLGLADPEGIQFINWIASSSSAESVWTGDKGLRRCLQAQVFEMNGIQGWTLLKKVMTICRTVSWPPRISLTYDGTASVGRGSSSWAWWKISISRKKAGGKVCWTSFSVGGTVKELRVVDSCGVPGYWHSLPVLLSVSLHLNVHGDVDWPSTISALW